MEPAVGSAAFRSSATVQLSWQLREGITLTPSQVGMIVGGPATGQALLK